MTQDTFPKEYLPPFFLSREANLMFGWLGFCFGAINLFGFLYQGWEWAWELEVHAHLVYCGGEYVEYTRINVACLCGSLIGYKRRSKLKQSPTNYKKVKKEPRWIHIRFSTTLIIDLCVQWNGHSSYHWHKTLHSSTTTHMSTIYRILIIILGYIIATKRK